jgi:hypothetical protein
LEFSNFIKELPDSALDGANVAQKHCEHQILAVENSCDPLLLRAEMPLEADYFPLGFKVHISTNSEEVLLAAEDSWGCFPSKASLLPDIKLRIGVLEGSSLGCPPAPIYRSYGNQFSIVADRENFLTCALEEGAAFGWLSRGAARHRSYFRYHLLEGAVLSLLCATRITPLHGACVEREGCGILLCGDSGAGKSTLAFACACAGWTFISDDSSHLLNSNCDRIVVGNSHKMRFRATAVKLFPELEGLSITPRAAGKPSIELPTKSLPHIRTAAECQVDRIVFLSRRDSSPPGLSSYPRDAARDWFAESIDNAGGEMERRRASFHTLLAVPIYELRYSGLAWAVSRLNTLAVEGK